MVFLLISIQLCDKNFWNIYFYTRLLKVNIFKKFQILQDFQTYLNLKKAALINSPMEGMSLKKFRCLYCLLYSDQTHCFGFSIVGFEQADATWEVT